MREISLAELLSALGLSVSGSLGRQKIQRIIYDSRQVKPGDFFVAVPGFKEDGAKYIPAAFKAGAAAALVTSKQNISGEFLERCFESKDVRRDMAALAAKLNGYPSRELLCIGVTGTKGKTSTTFLLESILKANGHPTALLGTNLCRYPGFEEPAQRTTRESPELQSFFRSARDHGVDAAVLEVSAHALSLHRSTFVEMDAVVFTNLSPDHLDFYGDMEGYYQGKRILFTQYESQKKGKPIGIVNKDNPYGARLVKESNIPVKSYGLSDADYTLSDAHEDESGLRCKIHCPDGKTIQVHSHLVGSFNLENLLAAAATAHALGIPVADIEKGIEDLHGIPGRLERVPTTLPFEVFVDFAHVGLALQNVLQTLRPLTKGRLIAVFGAGGDKPLERRTGLGSAAARFADESWLTADNPRSEDPRKIIDAIVGAFEAEKTAAKYHIEPDRRLAIEAALKDARPGDIICIAGKGHQTDHTIGDKVYPFDDREEARRVLRELERNKG